jgi:hypothetical protein
MSEGSMRAADLVFGIVTAQPPAGDAERKLRDLTISWTRYSYRGVILEGESVESVIEAARARGYAHCYIQRAGNLIRERWVAGARAKDLPDALEDLQESARYRRDGVLFSPSSLLVDVRRHQSLAEFTADVAHEAEISSRTIDLATPRPEGPAAFSGYLGDKVIGSRERFRADGGLSDEQREFLGVIERQAANARRGVFLWNLESYDDVAADAEPIGSLYSVAAGFKPNGILHRHGFDADSRVVYMDYSPRALAVRRCMVEEWDGRDFPRFARYLFARHPYPGTHYHLWGDLTPADVSDAELDAAWERELQWWGSADAFREHWRTYRELPHEYVECNLLDDPAPVLDVMTRSTRSTDVVWWSNAFFTMYGNWFLSQEARQESYERWMNGLAKASPDALLYGSDHANANVNGIRAAEYAERYRAIAPSYLEPAALHAAAIRM